MSQRFLVRNEGFTCVMCGAENGPAVGTCRDHCTECLVSLHVDLSPGDRANPCRGILQPIGVTWRGGSMERIRYQCQRCRALHVNRIAEDDCRQALLALAVEQG
ncbi:RNHCP domain-containing protein [Candidatus Peribacteria bacterium]|nr:RNHCP domain-containing protein [Candidatus Peribacteria bacterium]